MNKTLARLGGLFFFILPHFLTPKQPTGPGRWAGTPSQMSPRPRGPSPARTKARLPRNGGGPGLKLFAAPHAVGRGVPAGSPRPERGAEEGEAAPTSPLPAGGGKELPPRWVPRLLQPPGREGAQGPPGGLRRPAGCARLKFAAGPSSGALSPPGGPHAPPSPGPGKLCRGDNSAEPVPSRSAPAPRALRAPPHRHPKLRHPSARSAGTPAPRSPRAARPGWLGYYFIISTFYFIFYLFQARRARGKGSA